MPLWYLNRQVSIEEGDAKSRESGIMFIETSAKAGFNIKVKIMISKVRQFYLSCFWILLSVIQTYQSVKSWNDSLLLLPKKYTIHHIHGQLSFPCVWKEQSLRRYCAVTKKLPLGDPQLHLTAFPNMPHLYLSYVLLLHLYVVFILWQVNPKLQPLFRKIASSLPGMETLSSAKQDDMVDVNLKSTANSSQTEKPGGGCSC